MRPFGAAARTVPRAATRSFHSTRPAFVAVGDPVPNVDLFEGTPGNKVSLFKEFGSKNGIIIGVPGAFSMSILASTRLVSCFHLLKC